MIGLREDRRYHFLLIDHFINSIADYIIAMNHFNCSFCIWVASLQRHLSEVNNVSHSVIEWNYVERCI